MEFICNILNKVDSVITHNAVTSSDLVKVKVIGRKVTLSRSNKVTGEKVTQVKVKK